MILDDSQLSSLASFRSILTLICGEAVVEPDVTDIICYPPRLGEDRCLICTIANGQVTDRHRVRPIDVETALKQLAGLWKRDLHPKNPSIDAVLPDGGERIHGTIWPESPGPYFNIRKPYPGRPTLDDLAETGMLTAHQLTLIRRAVNRPEWSAVWCGPVNSGKTTLQRAALTEPKYMNGLPLICQDPYEFEPPPPRTVSKNADPFGEAGLDMTRLLRNGLRTTHNSASIGEARGAELLPLLVHWKRGYPGMITLHAITGYEIPTVAGQIIGLGGHAVGPEIRQLIGSVVNLIVHVERPNLGRPRVTEVLVCQWDKSAERPNIKEMTLAD